MDVETDHLLSTGAKFTRFLTIDNKNTISNTKQAYPLPKTRYKYNYIFQTMPQLSQ